MSEPGPCLVVLLHRHGCHLCDDMLDRLRDLEVAWGFRTAVRDVDADPDLVRRYDDKVPVLQGSGTEICRYVLDEEALRRYLKSR